MGKERSTERSEYLVLTATKQREADGAAERAGVARERLMEAAGSGAADWILERLGRPKTLVLVGPGGNGGDGLVLARRMAAAGAEVEALIAAPEERLSDLTRLMHERLVESGGRAKFMEGGIDPDRILEGAELIVDSLFGTGMNRPLGGVYRDLVGAANASDASVVSLDLPSGLPSDSGAIIGEAVRADVTLAMEFLKPAHLLFPSSSYCGDVAVVPIDYPEGALKRIDPFARVLTGSGARDLLPQRRPDGHKGTFGRLLVVAGSTGMSGAAILCCRGALCAGAGLVTLAVPESLLPIVEASLPEAVTIPLPEEDGHLAPNPLKRLVPALSRADAVAIGPGLSRGDGVKEAVASVLSSHHGPYVIDADAIAAIADPDILSRIAGRAVLTPHPGELSGLIDLSTDEIDRDRVEVARRFAADNNIVLLLKGRPTVIAIPGGGLYLNPTGNTGLATGGSGDVLTGLIGGFLAGGAPLGDAALLGAYLHGLAAELYARDRSERSLTPSDLVDALPYAIREVERWS